MKAIQITVIKGKEVLGTVLRATTVTDEELIMMIAQDSTSNDCKNLVIEPGVTINAGTEWYFWGATGIQKITGTADWCTNTAWFYDVKTFNDAIKEGMEFRGFNQNTVVNFYIQPSTESADTEDTAAEENKDADKVSDAKKEADKRILERLFGKKHGVKKEKVAKKADDDINFCNIGITALIKILRDNDAAEIADKLQDLLYRDIKTMTPESLRGLATKLNGYINDRISFLEKYSKGKKFNEIAVLTIIIDGKEQKRGLIDMLVNLLLWTYQQVQDLCKQWSGNDVFFPLRVLMGALKGVLDLFRTIGGGLFYIVNGVFCFSSAALLKLETWVSGCATHVFSSIKGWFTKKDEVIEEETVENPFA